VYRNRFGFLKWYFVSPAFGGDRRIGEVMMKEMDKMAERHSKLLTEA